MYRTCFPFESFYGKLLKFKSGTKYTQSHMMLSSAYYLACRYIKNCLKIDNTTTEGKLLQNIGLDIIQKLKYII